LKDAGNPPASGAAVSNIRFTAPYFACDAELAATGDKVTVLFPIVDNRTMETSSFPDLYKTGSSSLNKDSIGRAIRNLSHGLDDPNSNPFVFDLAFNDEWFNIINIREIKAVNGVPAAYMTETEAERAAREEFKRRSLELREAMAPPAP
jgi:hypothetical protein